MNKRVTHLPLWALDVSLGSIQTGSVVMAARYDGLGRRIVKAVKNSADLNATYHYHYHHQQLIETRNGSDLVLKQHVWAPGSLNYIDELVQIALNDDPIANDDCESVYFALHNANYNVMALVDGAGAMVERYEYSPYGQRQVYFSPGPNDPGAHAPIAMSRRWSLAGGGTAAPADGHPYGLNTFGHQGLMHGEHTSLVHNRARTLHPRLGRFMQRDPLGYVDGMNLYQYARSQPTALLDPYGLETKLPDLDDLPPGLQEKLLETLLKELPKQLAEGGDFEVDNVKIPDHLKPAMRQLYGRMSGLLDSYIRNYIDGLDGFASSSSCRQWYVDTHRSLQTGENCDKIGGDGATMSGAVQRSNFVQCWEDVLEAGGGLPAQSFQVFANKAQENCIACAKKKKDDPDCPCEGEV